MQVEQWSALNGFYQSTVSNDCFRKISIVSVLVIDTALKKCKENSVTLYLISLESNCDFLDRELINEFAKSNVRFLVFLQTVFTKFGGSNVTKPCSLATLPGRHASRHLEDDAMSHFTSTSPANR